MGTCWCRCNDGKFDQSLIFVCVCAFISFKLIFTLGYFILKNNSPLAIPFDWKKVLIRMNNTHNNCRIIWFKYEEIKCYINDYEKFECTFWYREQWLFEEFAGISAENPERSLQTLTSDSITSIPIQWFSLLHSMPHWILAEEVPTTGNSYKAHDLEGSWPVCMTTYPFSTRDVTTKGNIMKMTKFSRVNGPSMPITMIGFFSVSCLSNSEWNHSRQCQHIYLCEHFSILTR